MISRPRNTARYAACFLFGILAASSASALDTPQVARTKYDALKAKAEQGDLNIDWQELRVAAAVAGVNGNYDWRTAAAEAVRELNGKYYKEALAIGQQIVSHNYANADGHFLLIMLYGRLGMQKEADQEKLVVDKMAQSILDSGNGLTPETAWFIVTLSEESFVLRLLGMTQKSLEYVVQGGHAFDKVTAIDRSGKESTYWFSVDTGLQMSKRPPAEK